jgi:hypothetical protein
MAIDRHRRRTVALAEARIFSNLNVPVAHGAESLFQIRPQVLRTTDMTRHIHTDIGANLGLGRQKEVREEVRDPVNMGQRYPRPLRQSDQLIGGQVPVLSLNGS